MILGIDYGEKYIGLALSDEKVKIAFPYRVIRNKGLNSVLTQIKAICQHIQSNSLPTQVLEPKRGLTLGPSIDQKEKVKMIVIGRPLGMAGQKTRQTKLTDQFITKLKKQIDIPIIVEDERLTSQAAKRLLTKTESDHALAAMIILQNYLDKEQKVD